MYEKQKGKNHHRRKVGSRENFSNQVKLRQSRDGLEEGEDLTKKCQMLLAVYTRHINDQSNEISLISSVMFSLKSRTKLLKKSSSQLRFICKRTCMDKFKKKKNIKIRNGQLALQKKSKLQYFFLNSIQLIFSTYTSIFLLQPFNETVKICNSPLVRTCSADTQGPDICNTYYETNCETTYKTYEVEQDEPVCKMEIQKRCDDVTSMNHTGSSTKNGLIENPVTVFSHVLFPIFFLLLKYQVIQNSLQHACTC